jgi:SAM-dependent methyltransferase
MEGVIRSYSDLAVHRKIGELIKEHSENHTDIRSVAVGLIAWDETRRILDLGCGYGWFEEGLRGPFGLVAGIDCLLENEAPFLATARRISKEATFRQTRLPSPIDGNPASFDLVVSAYSLYFFPGIIPEVKRLLRPGGRFLVITHSETMLEEGERFFDFRNLRKVIKRFSAESGDALLRRHFPDVAVADYPNGLVFRSGDDKDLAQYIEFKREFISRDVSPDLVREKMVSELATKGMVRFNKDDRLFVARK